MRYRMVMEQLIGRGISAKKVLDAFFKVPRHEFVSGEFIDNAYDDHPLPIGEGQTISQPYMVALMTECLGLEKTDRVLEIGTGSGYQTAVLAEIAKEVYSVEKFASLAAGAKEILARLGYKNCAVMVGDGTLGWPEHAPYDKIIVTAGAPVIPQSLVGQLNEEGRLVIPVGDVFSQVLTIVEKHNNSVKAQEVCGCVFVPLVGREGWPDRKTPL
jgi:protein-L-isoaspartate(D-aspartate) O-methyltransferase